MTYSHNGHPESLRENVAELLSDVGNLAELQWQLFAVDTRQAWQRSVWPLIGILGAAAVGLGALPVLLLGIAHGLVEWLGMSIALAYLCVALVFLVTSGVAAKLSISRLRAATASFRRSREELQQNIQWMRRVVQSRGRPERLPAAPGPAAPR